MNQRIVSTPWHMGLEAWCAQHWGTAQQAGPAAAEWAPYEAHKPERFHHVPSVLVVLTANTRHLHRGFVGAVELLRASTSGFKAVLVTDMYRSPAAEVCEWPVEQVVDESLWLRQSCANWLDYAAEQVVTAQQFYGASYVIAPRDAAEARSLVEHLGRAYNVLGTVRDSALEVLAAGSEPEPQPTGFRSGWGELWDQLQDGGGSGPVNRVFTDYAFTEHDDAGTLTAQICTVDIGTGHRGVLLAAGELADPALVDAASRAGWSTVVLETGDPAPSWHFLAGAVRACAEALSVDAAGSRGPVLAALPAGWPDVPQAAGVLSRGADDRGGEAPSWRLHLPGLGSVEFTSQKTAAVLAELRSLCR